MEEVAVPCSAVDVASEEDRLNVEGAVLSNESVGAVANNTITVVDEAAEEDDASDGGTTNLNVTAMHRCRSSPIGKFARKLISRVWLS